MSNRASLTLILSLLLFFESFNEAYAVPTHISIEKIIKSSESIAIARWHGIRQEGQSVADLEILKVLKGNLKKGRQDITFHCQPTDSSKTTQMLVFLDEHRVWKFVATPTTIRDDVMRGSLTISVLSKFEHYQVSPDVITFDQLTGYLEQGSLVYRFRGNIYFPSSECHAWHPSSIKIFGSYDVLNRNVNVNDFCKLKGFRLAPIVTIQEGFHLMYSAGRTLIIKGNIHNIDENTGEYIVHFFVYEPIILRKELLERYAANFQSEISYCLRLTCISTDNKMHHILNLRLPEIIQGELDGYGETSLNIIHSSYYNPRGGVSSGLGDIDELPKSLLDENFKQDGVLRMNVKTNTGRYLTIGFHIDEPLDNEFFPFYTTNHLLLSAVYQGKEINGTVTLYERTLSRKIFDTTTTLEPLDTLMSSIYLRNFIIIFSISYLFGILFVHRIGSHLPGFKCGYFIAIPISAPCSVYFGFVAAKLGVYLFGTALEESISLFTGCFAASLLFGLSAGFAGQQICTVRQRIETRISNQSRREK